MIVTHDNRTASSGLARLIITQTRKIFDDSIFKNFNATYPIAAFPLLLHGIVGQRGLMAMQFSQRRISRQK